MNAAAEQPSAPSNELAPISLTDDPPATTEEAPRRRVWPWVLAGVGAVLVVLLVIGGFVADGIIRGIVRGEVESRVVSALGLAEGTRVEVEVGGGAIIPQLLAGRLDEVDIEVPELVLGDLEGSVELQATGVPLDSEEPLGTLTGTFTVTETQLVAIADALTGVDPEGITLEDPEIVVSSSFEVLGFAIPVGLGVEPGIDAGALVFTPTSVRLGDERFTAEEFTSNPTFGFLARQLLQQQSVCLAELLPAAIELSDAEVAGSSLVLSLSAEDAVLGDSSRGSCSS